MRKLTVALLVLAAVAAPCRAADSGALATSVQATQARQVNVDGERALELGEYTRAQSILSAALNSANSGTREEAYLHTALGEALLWQGKISDAGKELKRAQSLSKKLTLDPELQSRLLDALSWYYEAQGDMNSAVDACNQGLQIRRANQTSVSPFFLVSSLMHMEYLMEKTGQLNQALQLAQEALPIQIQVEGPQSLDAADIVEKLGSLNYKLGNTAEANSDFQRALQIKMSTNAAVMPFAPHPYWENVTYRFVNGAPNCSRNFSSGNEQEIVSANGVTIAASVSSQPVDLTKGKQIDLVLKNDSGRPVQFLPKPPMYIVMAPKISVAPMIDSAKLADSVEKKGERKAAWIKFWGADATMPVTSTFIGDPGFFGYPPIYNYNGAPPIINRNGNITTVTTQVPDYAAQARAMQKAADATARAQQSADSIRSQSLGPTTVPPGKTLSGSFFFDANRADKSVLRIPVGNATYEFQFPGQ